MENRDRNWIPNDNQSDKHAGGEHSSKRRHADNEGESQKDLTNQNDHNQDIDHDFDKKGSNEFEENITERKDENKKKQLYEEENKDINKNPPNHGNT